MRITIQLVMVGVLTVFSFSAFSRERPFIRGVDISWVDERENSGIAYADNGVVKGIFGILKEHKGNWIRIRLFKVHDGGFGLVDLHGKGVRKRNTTNTDTF